MIWDLFAFIFVCLLLSVFICFWCIKLLCLLICLFVCSLHLMLKWLAMALGLDDKKTRETFFKLNDSLQDDQVVQLLEAADREPERLKKNVPGLSLLGVAALRLLKKHQQLTENLKWSISITELLYDNARKTYQQLVKPKDKRDKEMKTWMNKKVEERLDNIPEYIPKVISEWISRVVKHSHRVLTEASEPVVSGDVLEELAVAARQAEGTFQELPTSGGGPVRVHLAVAGAVSLMTVNDDLFNFSAEALTLAAKAKHLEATLMIGSPNWGLGLYEEDVSDTTFDELVQLVRNLRDLSVFVCLAGFVFYLTVTVHD